MTAAHERREAAHADTLPASLGVRKDMADAMALPLFVEQLAEAMSRYATDTLEVVDLAPGDGMLATRLLRAFERRQAPQGTALAVRLHLCGDRRSMLARHPTLREAAAKGRVRWLDWDPAAAIASPRLGERVAVLALGYFQQLPVEICAVHYTEWFTSDVDVQPQAEGEGVSLRYRWRGGEDASALGQSYRDKLGSAALNLPHAGHAALAAISAATGGRYLLIAADSGAADLRDIVDGALTPPSAWRAGESSMPVNFHALAWAQPRAIVAHCRTSDEMPLLHVAVAGEEDAYLSAWIVEPLRHGMDTAWSLRDTVRWMAEDAPLPTRLAVFERAAFDPHALGSPRSSEGLDIRARDAWRDGLERAWELARDETSAEASLHVGICAADLALWGMATRVLAPLVRGVDDAGADRLAWASLCAGDIDTALALCGSRGCEDAAWKSYIRDYGDFRASLPWFHSGDAIDDELRLEPLATHHALECFHQYRDAHIGIMTRLPELDSLDAVREWIACQQSEASRASFAVVHREHGFVGATGYQRAGQLAYFHFWIGVDHQNRGLGRRAARLLQSQARASGITSLYTSVYRDNPRSLAALHALGFDVLEARAPAPDDELVFFHRPVDAEALASVDALRELCGAIGCPFLPVGG